MMELIINATVITMGIFAVGHILTTPRKRSGR